MGQNFGASVYRVTDIAVSITRHRDRALHRLAVTDVLDITMPRFGRVAHGEFTVVTNEAWEGYDPATEFESFIARYYGIRYWRWMPKEVASITGGANADEEAYALGLVLPDEDDEPTEREQS